MFKSLKRELNGVLHSKQRSIFFSWTLLLIFGGLLPIILVMMPRMIVSYVETNKTNDQLTNLILIMGSLVILFSAINTYVDTKITAKTMTFRINEFVNYYRIYLNVPYENMENAKWLDNAQRQKQALSGDGDGYQGTLDTISKLLPIVLTAIIYSVLLAIVSPFILITIVIFVAVSYISENKARNYEYKKRNEAEHIRRREQYFSKTATDFTYTKDIKVFNLKGKILSMLKNEINSFKKIRKQIEAHIFLWSILESISMALLLGLTLYFALDNYNKDNKISNLVLAILVVINLIPVLTSAVTYYSTLLKNLKEVKEYYEYIDENNKEEKVLEKIDINDALEIEFKDVSFKYPNTDKYIFKNLSFKINKEEKVAIVGINGAGKSTIVKLILGFFKPTSGEILINGYNINDFNRKDLYKLYGVVFQDVNVYAFSVLENISMKQTDESDREKAIDCLKHVGVYDVIDKLPHKENQTMLKHLDPEGVELSGGQTQKLAIARALYKENTRCIILDEPTAALDALAEADIYQSFKELVTNKTAIYISHRLSSTKFCDRIMLFDETGLCEVGNHEELMNLKGKYFEMFEIQGKYYREASHEELMGDI